MQTVLRLDRRYDTAMLLQDLERATRAGEYVLNRPTYHDGGWRALALVAVDGGTDAKALRWAGEGANYRKTPILEACPYFASIVDGFRCPVQRVRLLRLEPGAKIHEHVDLGDGWAMRRVRLHIPIVTSDAVEFYADGQRVRMKPGELWYCDFTRPHRVHNASDVGRVHMVLDMTVDRWLREFFPPEPWKERLAGYARYAQFHGKARLKDVARRTGVTAVAKRLLAKKGEAAAPEEVADKFD